MNRIFLRTYQHLAVGFCVVAMAGISHAAKIVATSADGDYSLQLTDPVSVGGGAENLLSSILQVVNNRGSNSDANVTVFDGAIGINGSLHHERAFSPFNPSPTAQSFTNVGQTVSSLDSYFNNTGNAIEAPAEVGATSASTATPQNAGNAVLFGPSLTGLFSLGVQGTTANIAHLVAADGATISVDFAVGNAIIGEDVRSFAASFVMGGALPATGSPAAGDVSDLLQGAFSNRMSGPAILPIMIMDGVVQSFDLVVDQSELGSFVQVEDLDEDGKYNLVLSGPFNTLDPGTIISGSLSFLTDNGNVDYSFSVAVPEPSTVALTGLAMVGLVGFLRRKNR